MHVYQDVPDGIGRITLKTESGSDQVRSALVTIHEVALTWAVVSCVKQIVERTPLTTISTVSKLQSSIGSMVS